LNCIHHSLNFRGDTTKGGTIGTTEGGQKPDDWEAFGEHGTFGKSFIWDQIQELHSTNYKKSDIDKTFFVYDCKHTGEHRVRLVFDGSRQT
jgi:hypothetical protein